MRKPIVAGQFYPAEIKGLNAFLNNCKTIVPKPAYGAVSPHAGYFFSGQTSMKAISSIDYNVDTVIILGPNHNGIGQDIAISKQDWITPYGLMHNDTEFSNKLADNIGSIDETAHVNEHSIEVILPILQYVLKKRNQKVKFVPICMKNQSIEKSGRLAEAIIKVENELNRKIVIIASSDFSHYEPRQTAEEKDKTIISYLINQDVNGFDDYRKDNKVSICGHGPIITLTIYSKIKGLKKTELLEYIDSGETTGNCNDVVGYAAVRYLK